MAQRSCLSIRIHRSDERHLTEVPGQRIVALLWPLLTRDKLKRAGNRIWSVRRIFAVRGRWTPWINCMI